MKEVRRLIWVADLDHRQIIALAVVCEAVDGRRVTKAPDQVSDQLSPTG